jgi:glutathione S-transferase
LALAAIAVNATPRCAVDNFAANYLRTFAMMKLYFAPGVCSLAPHIVFKEAGVPFQAVKTDIRAKTFEAKNPDGTGDYRSISPLGYVPALQLADGTVLTEGPAIVQYIADQAPHVHLTPAKGSSDHYKMLAWLNFISTEVHKGFTPLLSPMIVGKLTDEAKAVFVERLTGRLAHIEKHLTSNDFLLGRAFTIADAYCFTTLRWTAAIKLDIAPYPHIQAYMKRVQARPAVQAAMQAEGLH